MIQVEITPLQAIAFCQWTDDFKKLIIRASGSDPISKAKAISCVDTIEKQIKTHILKETTIGNFENSDAEKIV